MPNVFAFCAILLLAGCSSAGWGEGYGPKDEGFVGSAFGYEDTRLSATQWYLAYTDVGVPRTMQKAHRRAKELCKKAGFPEYEFSATGNPQVDQTTIANQYGGVTTVGGLTTIAGAVNCSRAAGGANSPS